MGYTRISVFGHDAEKGDEAQAKKISDVTAQIEKKIPSLNNATMSDFMNSRAKVQSAFCLGIALLLIGQFKFGMFF